jgi:hypothetical protein
MPFWLESLFPLPIFFASNKLHGKGDPLAVGTVRITYLDFSQRGGGGDSVTRYAHALLNTTVQNNINRSSVLGTEYKL